MKKTNENGTTFIIDDFHFGIIYAIDEYVYSRCLTLFDDSFSERRNIESFLSNFDKNDIEYFKNDKRYVIDRDGYSISVEIDSYWNTVRIKPIWITKIEGDLPIDILRKAGLLNC